MVKGKAGNFREKVVKKAKEAGIPIEAQPATQPELLDVPAQPKAVRNGCIMMQYLEPKYREGEDERLLTLHLSFPLSEDHAGHLPKKIEEAWRFMIESGDKMHVVTGVRPQSMTFFTDPGAEEDKPLFKLSQGSMTSVKLIRVVEKGKGKRREYIRLSFGIEIDAAEDTTNFATTSFGGAFWCELYEQQRKLKSA